MRNQHHVRAAPRVVTLVAAIWSSGRNAMADDFGFAGAAAREAELCLLETCAQGRAEHETGKPR